MKHIYSAAILCFIFHLPLAAQTQKDPIVEREAQITYSQDENQVDFSAITPPLQQIQGAPAAFYSFYWEFGDGHYSFDPKPRHAYKKTGEHKVQLWTTNNYDNGKPPPSRPQKIPVKKITYENTPPPSKEKPDDDAFQLKINRSPVPEQELILIASYKNTSGYATSGKLYLYYNEKKFKADNFTLTEVRTHHGERQVKEEMVTAALSPVHEEVLLASTAKFPFIYSDDEEENLALTLDESESQYRNSHVLEFDEMSAGEERNVFCSFVTTPEMLKDTSATITIRGIYVPDRGKTKHRKKDLEMEIVTSHDPNNMSVSDARLNYRFFRKSKLQFKVRFQNNGEGPARSIKLNVSVSDMFDKQSMQVVDMSPKCPICPDSTEVTYSCLDTAFTEDKIIFHFKNIYLPGSRQDNVNDMDSTNGFVKYSIRFNKKVPKKNTVNRTAIVFDKNEPVYTNYSCTRFKPGLSLGLRAGYHHVPERAGSKNFFTALTVSPYKAQRGYWQAELMVARHTFSDSASYEDRTLRDDRLYDVFDVDERRQYTHLSLYVVPASYRYALNKIFGVGAGMQIGVNASEKTRINSRHQYSLVSEGQFGQGAFRERNPSQDYALDEVDKKSFTTFNAALFADVGLGSSRIGPSLGIRYYRHFSEPREQWQFYAAWKF